MKMITYKGRTYVAVSQALGGDNWYIITAMDDKQVVLTRIETPEEERLDDNYVRILGAITYKPLIKNLIAPVVVVAEPVIEEVEVIVEETITVVVEDKPAEESVS